MSSTTDSEVPAAEDAPDTVESCRDQGNTAIRAGRFAEAVLHYSRAIRLNAAQPPDATLFSNRSLAHLRLRSFYEANADAERAIELRPDWAKAHYRRAEVQAAAGQYDSALLSYARAMQLQPTDGSIMAAAKRAAFLCNNEEQFEQRLPWLGAGLGIVIGVVIVLCDQLATKIPSMRHPALMVLLVMCISAMGYGAARLVRYYRRLQLRGRLEPPLDLLADVRSASPDRQKRRRQQPTANAQTTDANADVPEAARMRYSKAQARQRFRRGKT